MSNNAVDRDRLEAYQRKMNNPAEMLMGNVVIGSMIGMFVGYMSGAAFGVWKWKRECFSSSGFPLPRVMLAPGHMRNFFSIPPR